MRKFNIIILVLLVAALLIAATPWTSRQTALHALADGARALGLPEDNPIIRECQFLWWAESEDAKILAKMLNGECKDCSDRHQQLTARTPYNRILDDSGNFPNTIREVITQPGQYSQDYARNLPDYFTADADMQRCFRNAYVAFLHEVDCPDTVIYASEFPPGVLGSACYEESKVYINGVLFSTTYFNYR